MPLISVITPVFDPPAGVFAETIESVLRQRFADWEWILVDDGSADPEVHRALDELERREVRVRVIRREANGGIVAATNDGIQAAAGEFLAFLDNDDLLRPRALERVAEAIAAIPDIDYLYTDEDKLFPDGSVGAEFRKPVWSPERLRGQMYTSHLSVMRTALVRELGGMRPGFDGSQDHDLVLRVTERARVVHHIPHPLYRWRVIEGSTAGDGAAKPYAWDAGVRAVSDHLERVGIRASVRRGLAPSTYTIDREPDLSTPTSVVIPTRGTAGIVRGAHRVYVVEMVRSLLEATRHRDLEVVVVYDTGTPESVLAALREIGGDRIVLVEFTEAFNFSRKCNVGSLHARGEALVFMNDDMEAYTPGPIEQLIAPLREDGVGMTGPRLLFEDTTHQHAGLAYGGGDIAHGHYRLPRDSNGYFASLYVNREVSALTGACIAVRRETFERVGGFSERLALNFNDVDFCLKVRFLGLRLLWLEAVTLFHFESVSRSTEVSEEEAAFMMRRWGDFRRMPDAYALPIWGG
ncbi:MAG: glycosyltransferase [Microbacteriaceae bacterium]